MNYRLFCTILLTFAAGVNADSIMLQARRVQDRPQLDGDLSEPVWHETPPFSQFRMVEPTPNGEPSELTDLRVIYDGDALYLGITCHDSEPGRIKSNTLAHDVFD